MELTRLIENYFAITKRPISTLTVDEYLTFVKAGEVKVPVVPPLEEQNKIIRIHEDNSETNMLVQSDYEKNTPNHSNVMKLMRGISG